jgi:hypothetical protein
MLVIPGVNAPGRVRARSVPLPPLEPAEGATASESPVLQAPTQPRVAQPSSPPATVPLAPLARPGAIPASPVAPTAPRPRATAPEAARPTNRLGRYLAAPFSTGRGPVDNSAITVEPSTDPAAEAALKRRIERQIRDMVGERAREVEVRVVGRDVTIRAHGVRFWQRRSVRRTLESLPVLAGYRPSIEIVE